MKRTFVQIISLSFFIILIQSSCQVPKVSTQKPNLNLPNTYPIAPKDTLNLANFSWKSFYQDPNLVSLIDQALANNQELNIFLQELNITQYEIQARKGEYLPFVSGLVGAGVEKEALNTKLGAVEEQLEPEPGKHFPSPLPDFQLGLNLSWEIDIWKKLRNAKKAAMMRYLATQEGRNFLVTQLVAEIAENYYELLALDSLNQIINQSMELQEKALDAIKQQKEASKVTQLAVNRFEAQLLKTQNLRFEILNKITAAENRIRFLTGSISNQPIVRSTVSFTTMPIDSMLWGVPGQLLMYRPDVKQASYGISAAELEMYSARAAFLPALSLRTALGIQAFDPTLLLEPHAIFFRFLPDLMAPLINRNLLNAQFKTRAAQYKQAILTFEQKLLNAYYEVLNQVIFFKNYEASLKVKGQEVTILQNSIQIANNLFASARADYLEVLLTQREALEAQLELIEIQLNLLKTKVNLYRVLGGGWR